MNNNSGNNYDNDDDVETTLYLDDDFVTMHQLNITSIHLKPTFYIIRTCLYT